MNAQKGNKTLIGAGVAACAVCCAGPILAVLAAIGVSTAAGYMLFGSAAVLLGAAITAFLLWRRRRSAVMRAAQCEAAEVAVELTSTGKRS